MKYGQTITGGQKHLENISCQQYEIKPLGEAERGSPKLRPIALYVHLGAVNDAAARCTKPREPSCATSEIEERCGLPSQCHARGVVRAALVL
jgi:hypothetical protein